MHKTENKSFAKMPPKSQCSNPTQGGTFVKPAVRRNKKIKNEEPNDKSNAP